MEFTMIDFTLIAQSLPDLYQGALVSLQIMLTASLVGISLGSVLSLAETSSFKMIRFCVGIYVTLVRGTPMLVQILFLFYVLPQFGIMIAPFWAASLAIGLNSSAYVSQIIKSGVNAIPKGQIEAARTLGFSCMQTKIYIIFPQAFRVTLPALGNELVTLVKDSSLASIIGVMELTKEASIIRSRTYDAFSILLAVSIIYLLLTATLSLGIKYLEKRTKSYA
jgi:polar amino acid transport system permease protein